jgi:acetyl esterase/lipase
VLDVCHLSGVIQDVVPATGLTLFKPSHLWPPPPEDVYLKVHDQLRGSMRSVIHPKPLSDAEPANHSDEPEIQPRFVLETGTASSGKLDETLRVKAQNGDHLTINRQIQLYTTNTLLKHPLVSPVLAYLGGLPPLFVIASDREVLRDEVIYTSVISLQIWRTLGAFYLTSVIDSAHRAANPAKYPVSEEAKRLYPALAGVERRLKPTAVHLQVYDGTFPA